MPDLAAALREPLALSPNRLTRFYRGGRLLDAFRGVPDAADDDRPEDWVGSATRAWTAAGRPPSPLGPSRVEVNGWRTTLEELVQLEPDALAGRELTERAGPTLGVLVKLLDAAERLPVHCHPSRRQAAALLGSRFGKTEAWLILGTRERTGRVWAGFREHVPEELLRDWIERQQTEVLLDALAEHPVAAGDVFFIPGGTPHAIGAGVFLLELQEPTDFSIIVETRDFPIDARDASLRLGWERALSFFDTRAAPPLRQSPRSVSSAVTDLLGPPAAPFFRALRMRLSGDAAPPFEPAYAVGVVLAGSGALHGASRRLELHRGVTVALPATAVEHARVSGEDLDLVWCLGPDPAALDRQPLPGVAAPA